MKIEATPEGSACPVFIDDSEPTPPTPLAIEPEPSLRDQTLTLLEQAGVITADQLAALLDPS